MNPYEQKLMTAKYDELAGRLDDAIRNLTEAAALTRDEEELVHLRIWRKRLERERVEERRDERGRGA